MNTKSTLTTTKYPFKKFIKDLTSLYKPYKSKFFTASILRFTSDLVKLYPAFAISQLVLLLTSNSDQLDVDKIYFYMLTWLGLYVYIIISHQFAKYIGYQVGENAALDLRKKSMRHIFMLDLDWQEKENSGNKLKRINKGRDAVDRLNRTFFTVIIESAINIILIVFIFWRINWLYGAIMSLFIITYYALSLKLTNSAVKQAIYVSAKEEELEGFSFEVINNISTIKALGIHSRINKIIKEHIEPLKESIRKRIFGFRRRNLILDLYYTAFAALMIYLIIDSIVTGRNDIAVFILFTGYLHKVEAAAFELGERTNEIIINKIYMHRLSDILQIKPSIEGVKGQQDYPEKWDKLEIRDLQFKYNNQIALDNVSFTIERGQKVGIVGISGSGKTTLFKLLLDLYEDYQGDILLDDKSLKNIARSDYINNVSVVLQDTELFNASLKENILLTRTDKNDTDEQKVLQVIKDAQLDEVVSRLEDGIDTVIGEKGVKLSGGEKQRLGIARALYRHPDILLLDEATSNLDVHSEKLIQNALHKAFSKTTAVVIAHRLSTVREMDKIVLLQKGKIMEEGSFDELIAKKGSFYKMWKEQTI